MVNLLLARIWITIVATTVAIVGAILAHFFSAHATLILTVETILLPAVYIIGSHIAEQTIEDKYSEDIDELSNVVYGLKEKYLKEKTKSKRYGH